MPSQFQVLAHVRQQLREIPAPVLFWRLLKKLKSVTRYYIARLIGHVAFPVLGCRAPLRGYYYKTRYVLQHGDGQYIDLKPPTATPESPTSEACKSEIFVAIIPRGRSLYDYGVVVSPDHRLLADVSWHGFGLVSEPRRHPAMTKLSLPPIQHIAGRVAIVTSLESQNYYHWMFDILPRFEILRRANLVPDYYVINSNTSFQRETLQILNIPSRKILNPAKSTHIQADELIVPSLLGPIFAETPQRQACAYLRSTFLQKNTTRNPRRAIYVTRADAKLRRLVNEPEVLEEVRDIGFEVISLSNMSFLQQVELFSEAKVIVGPHGAGFTNAVFCQPGSVLIEFVGQGWKRNNFEVLARFVGLEYHSVIGTEAHFPSDDFMIDRAAVSNLVRQFV